MRTWHPSAAPHPGRSSFKTYKTSKIRRLNETGQAASSHPRPALLCQFKTAQALSMSLWALGSAR